MENQYENMIDITFKQNTYRRAIAEAIVKTSLPETIDAVKNNTVPKGNVLEAARTAGLLGVKKTSDLIPDCHPLPIEQTSVSYDFDGLNIVIRMTVSTIYKTGVEVEAMHGASIVALTIYDMLKPIDKQIEISTIRLVEKKGGKSDYKDVFRKELKAAVVVCSDTISAGQKEDKAGLVIRENLEKHGVSISHYNIIPDEADRIESELLSLIDQKTDLIIFTGGTGLSSRDVTPETIKPHLDREIPGIGEVIRSYGQDRMPYAMLSRSIAGVKNGSLIMTLPGSTGGARESMEALFPHVLHVFHIISGGKH